MKSSNNIIEALDKFNDFYVEMHRLGMVLDISCKDIDLLSAHILEISKNTPITASQLAQVITEGAALDVPMNELVYFSQIFINAMFVLNESIPLVGHWVSVLIDALGEKYAFNQDIMDGANSVLMSIVYLVNVVNNKVVFVK